MKYPDWRAYESRQLTAQELDAARALLEQSEEARGDFQAYQEFKAALQEAARLAVPEERLGEMLSRIVRPAPAARRTLPRFLAPLAAAAAVLIVVMILVPRFLPSGAVVPARPLHEVVAKLETSNPKQAYEWIGKEVDFMIPPYRLTDVAKLTGASAGKGWGAYEYVMDGQPMQLVVRPNAYQFPTAETKQIGRTTFYVGKSIGFKCPYCAYELKGGDEVSRWKLAKAAATELFGGL